MRKFSKSKSLILALFVFVLQLVFPFANTLAATYNSSILPPSNLTAQLITPDDVKLTWSSVYGATGYNVYGITEGQLTLLGTTVTTSYTLNNLPEGSYSYVVSTLSSEGESGPCAPVNVDIIYPDMAAPATLTHTLQNGNDIVLNWDASQYAENYNIYQIAADDQKTLIATLTGRSYVIKNVPEGTYTYSVSAVNSLYGESSLSVPLQVNVVLPTMTAPDNLTYTVTNGNDLNLKWSPVSYATNYKVYQVIDGQQVLRSTVTGTNVKYTNMPAGDYVYKVYSNSDRFGESAEGSTISLTLSAVTMVPPSNLTYKIQNVNDIVLSWGTVPFAESYKVYQIIDEQQVLKSTITGTSVTYAKMPAGDYIFKVHSYSARFGESAEGSQASLTVGDVTMVPPSNLAYNIQNLNDIVLSWGTALNATSYKIYQIIDGQQVLKSTVTGTSVKYTNMPAGDYVYRVYSFSDRFGESADGSTVSITVDPVTMIAPSGFSYKIQNGNDIVLTWDTAANATSYKVYLIVNGQKVLKSTVTGTTVTYSNMPAGEYNYEVYSFSTRFGESQDGSKLSFSLVHPIMQPPANVSHVIKSAAEFTLNWDASEYATSYKVYQIVNGQKVLKSTVSGKTVTYTNMSPGDYIYEIYSYSSRFGESLAGSRVEFTLNGQTLQAPTGLTYSITNGNDITLKWTAVQYATSYKIYQVVDGQKVLMRTVTGTAVTFTNMPGGEYDYIVHSVSTLFGESPSGAEVKVPLVLPKLAAPGNFTYKIQNGNDVVLTWQSVQYATSYKVYKLVGDEKVLKSTVSSLSTTLSNAAEGEHVYVVHAVSTRFGESEEGSRVSFTLVFPTMQAPANPTNTITNGNDITLRWTAAPYAKSYKIYQVVDGQKVLKRTATGTSSTFVNMPEGGYKYEIHSYSDRFGESQEGSQISLTVVFPTMQAPANPTYSITNGNDITLRWTAAPYATSYKIYQIIDSKKTLVKTINSKSYAFVNMPEGDYSYEIHSYSDRFGESPTFSGLKFNLTWPVVQPPKLEGTILNVNNITLSWQAVTWANEYRLYNVTDGNRQLLHKGTALSYKVYNMTEDTHTFEVTAYSTRFGESQASNRITETIVYPVMQPPAANLVLLTETSARITWNFVTYANGYNVYEIIDGNPVLLVHNLNNLSFTVSDLSYANHEFYVTSFSNSFGESEPSNTVLAKLIVDTEPPVTSADAPTDWTNQNVVVTLAATDNETGVANTYYSLNDSEFAEGTSFTINEEGFHKVSFYSVDKAGNIEATKNINVKIDQTSPATEASGVFAWSAEPVVVSLNATDELSGIAKMFYSVNGSEFLEGASFTVSEEGINQVRYYSVDTAGNKEEAQTAEVKIDKSAPVITMNMNAEYELGDVIQLAYSANDDLSGVVSEKMTVTAPDKSSGQEFSNGAEITLETAGVYNISIVATNAAGLTTTIQKQFFVYIPASIEVTPKVIKGNKGVFTVRVNLPEGLGSQGFDLNTATLNGVKALASNNGYYNQAKHGQFKFERSDFIWNTPEVTLEFRSYLNGYLVVGRTTVKVKN